MVLGLGMAFDRLRLSGLRQAQAERGRLGLSGLRQAQAERGRLGLSGLRQAQAEREWFGLSRGCSIAVAPSFIHTPNPAHTHNLTHTPKPARTPKPAQAELVEAHPDPSPRAHELTGNFSA